MTQSLLFLGDSYTIGEGVSPKESWPWQLIERLKQGALPAWGCQWGPPRMIAQTGWTAGELLQNLPKSGLGEGFWGACVSAGVNDQYRQLAIEECVEHLEQLLQVAAAACGYRKQHLWMVGIPDWSQSPFAADRDRQQIASQIASFNRAISGLADRWEIPWIDLNAASQPHCHPKEAFYTSDKLHPSSLQYRLWVDAILEKLA
ncbi:MAG: SGNH/GDSL hydrolase family protein [Pirellulaceae bacterium]|jgi:lysophospholipase L1-like esterase